MQRTPILELSAKHVADLIVAAHEPTITCFTKDCRYNDPVAGASNCLLANNISIRRGVCPYYDNSGKITREKGDTQ